MCGWIPVGSLRGVIHVIIPPRLAVQPLLPSLRQPRPLRQCLVVLLELLLGCGPSLLGHLPLCLLELSVALFLGHHGLHLVFVLFLHPLKVLAFLLHVALVLFSLSLEAGLVLGEALGCCLLFLPHGRQSAHLHLHLRSQLLHTLSLLTQLR